MEDNEDNSSDSSHISLPIDDPYWNVENSIALDSFSDFENDSDSDGSYNQIHLFHEMNNIFASDDDDDDDDDMSIRRHIDDENDSMSEASTMVNEPLTQSGTDTEVESNHDYQEEREDREVQVHEEEIIQSQKKIKLDNSEENVVQNIANESIDEDQKCPICLETWSNSGEHRLCSLRCGHLFGLKCITQWFDIAQNANSRKCPECNTKASRRDIRVLYAKKLICIDTTELEKLRSDLKEAITRKDIIERDLKQFQTKEILYKQEINNLKLKVKNLEKTVNLANSERCSFGSMQNESINLRQCKIIDICLTDTCRVLAYNPWHKILIASSGSGISRVFMDSVSYSLNYIIHTGSIRDLAFQEQHPNTLLSVAFDKKINLTDIRNNLLTHCYRGETNLWSCCWSNYNSQTFFVGGAKGNIAEYDLRFLQNSVSYNQNIEDRSPVVSLASAAIPTSSSAPRGTGYLACQLNSCYAYAYKEGNYVGNKIDVEGPFTSLRYNEKDGHVLLSCRANARNPSVRHLVGSIEKIEDQVRFNTVHSFNTGVTQKLLSRPCYANLKNDTVVVAHNESQNSIVGWSMTTGKEAYNLPVPEPVVDVCFFNCDKAYQAVLTSNKLLLYQHKDTSL